MTQPSPAPAATRSVILASPREIDGKRHDADSTVKLGQEEARKLVRDGRARWADPEELDAMDRRVGGMPPASAKSSGATRATKSRSAATRPGAGGGE